MMRPILAKSDLLQYLLLVTQLVIVLTSFAVVGECSVTAWANPERCVFHVSTNSDREHSHPQPAAILPFTVDLAALSLTHVNTLVDLLPLSPFCKILNPPPERS
ncbi:MAG: hypothetical protein KF832_10285 [Caldilineaceae bacterium]|nr:hypothetical protein [Caldilineaceae bacterium]